MSVDVRLVQTDVFIVVRSTSESLTNSCDPRSQRNKTTVSVSRWGRDMHESFAYTSPIDGASAVPCEGGRIRQYAMLNSS